MRKAETYTISFRVDGRVLRQLEEGASQNEISVHAYARRLVQEILEDTERERVREEVQGVQQQVARLRDDVATALEMVLINLTSAEEEEIKAWVTRNLREGLEAFRR